ncbi:hypothetical protein P2G88_08205 [Aliiglaciecola sp. CAU 1673]|uniref:hypothetical protein n=1 Tax=Aliiglaciecola sp. CAU 1673 TaxID=3032595 RepID=UPI0023DAB538|nr:hypothetical protein [Aliiglaciecola sp. CAU 1673]MDF2178233.1 hypothetical protein [Aliiglaciecola sp. CAU 1673]
MALTINPDFNNLEDNFGLWLEKGCLLCANPFPGRSQTLSLSTDKDGRKSAAKIRRILSNKPAMSIDKPGLTGNNPHPKILTRTFWEFQLG